MSNKKPENTIKKRDRVSVILFVIRLAFLLVAAVVIIRIVQLNLTYRLDDSIVSDFKPKTTKTILHPQRGSIYSSDGRLLAMSIPMYQVSMDCRVRREEFAQDKKKGKENEAKWQADAKELSKGLASIFGERNADAWYKLIIDTRINDRNPINIGKPIGYETLKKVKALPLFENGQYKGGIISHTIDTRSYPYGTLARRVIGYVDNNSGTGKPIGLEGKFNHELHGEEGYEWKKETDKRQKIRDYGKGHQPAKDGDDINTTIDIDIQDFADKALREQIEGNPKIEGGCAIVMEVKTGAIRAMVNLKRDKSGKMNEIYNYAIGRSSEPGSVFKTALLLSLLEDGYVSLDTEIPTNHGKVGLYKADQHIADYERETGKNTISVLHGYEISSNYVFQYLAETYYGKNPQKLVDKYYMYKLGETWDFDIEGFARPKLLDPKSSEWSGTALGTMAIGYSNETPMHIATFYNAIANRGKMMKPYLVESTSFNGDVKRKYGPQVLVGSICSPATADTIKRAMKRVVEDGTGKRLKVAKCEVAGKTGTAWQTFEYTLPNGKKRWDSQDPDGSRQYQSTFVGFFPADTPQYTTLVTLYTVVGRNTLIYGGAEPARAFKNIVDKIYALDERYGEVMEKQGQVPKMRISEQALAEGMVPDVKGKSLADAVYDIENSGFRCVWSGTGHVRRQSPEPSAHISRGATVTLELR